MQLLSMSNRELPEATLNFYVEELKNIEMSSLIKAFKVYMAKARWPSVEDIEKLCNIETVYSAADHESSDALKSIPKADLANDIKNNETFCYRIEAPFPACTDLQASVKYWREKFKEIKNAGWIIFTWKEHESIRNKETESNGRITVQKQRIFFVMCFVCRPGRLQGTPFATCDFKADNQPLMKEWKE